MSRLLVDDVTKTDARALLNVNKMATISDIVAPSNEYIYASGANELTVVEGCVIAVGGAGIFKTANTILTAANLDAGSAFAVGKDYYVYICDSRIDSADEKYVIWERGTNEVTNKMIRRKIPKGTNFDDRTEKEVESIENWINGYPRKIHGYHSAGELFEEEVKQLA